jgi:hypothetical protein
MSRHIELHADRHNLHNASKAWNMQLCLVSIPTFSEECRISFYSSQRHQSNADLARGSGERFLIALFGQNSFEDEGDVFVIYFGEHPTRAAHS